MGWKSPSVRAMQQIAVSPGKNAYAMPTAFKDLVHAIARTFYEDKYVIILDMLVEEGLMRDDTIAARLHMNLRDSNKLVIKLKEDRLVQIEIKSDPKISEVVRPMSHYYYYIDGYRFIHVCKYRMFKMRMALEERIGQEEQQGYVCPRCGQTYTALDLNQLLDSSTGQILCENCHIELQLEAKSTTFQDSRERFVRFMNHTAPLVQLLQTMDQLTIPPYDPKDWLEEAAQIALRATTLAQVTQDIKHSAAQASDAVSPNIQVTIDSSLAQPKQSEKPQAAALPHWHAHSTVTGQRVVSKPTVITAVQASNAPPTTNVTVSVGSKSKPLSEITKADLEQMTPEEYEEYFYKTRSPK